MRVGYKVPGSWEGPLGEEITGWGIWVTGREGRKLGKGAPGLPNVGSAGTGGDEVISSPTICTETSVGPTTAFLHGEGAMATSGAIHVHGDMTRWGRGGGNG